MFLIIYVVDYRNILSQHFTVDAFVNKVIIYNIEVTFQFAIEVFEITF